MATAKPRKLQFDLDDEDLKVFSEEAEEQLEILDTALVQLEGEPDPDLVQQIFRAAHTLKGSSATIGHKKMAGLTHAMETVLDAVRTGKRQPSSEMVDALLASLDALRILTQEVVTRIDSGVETSGLEADLLAVLEAAPGPEAVAAAPPTVREIPAAVLEMLRQEAALGKAIFEATVTIDESCQLPSIRSFQVLQELTAVSTVHLTWPDRAAIESGAGDSTMTAIITTPADDELIRMALADVADVAAVEIVERTVEDLEAPSASANDGAAQPRLTVIEGAPAAAAAKAAPRGAAQSVRIDVERLDGLMNLVGELVIDRTRLQQIREQLSSVLKGTGLKELEENFTETAAHLARVTDELQEEIMRSRMLPVRSVLSRLPRMVRDIASKCGKKVELSTAGEETELDRSVIEEISDPLVHILRNAVDHGIETPEERRAAGKPETGAVSVRAWNQEASIYLAIRDDGAGIDADALRKKAIEKGIVPRDVAEAASDEAVLQYIFIPGLSTAKSLSDVSGRGVGMDIVRTNIERLNGQVTLKSTRGVGTEFLIRLPLTLATTKALMVTARGTVYAMPLVSVTEALASRDADIATAGGQPTLRMRDRLLPVNDLAHALGDLREPPDGPRFVVTARHGERHVAFLVDRLLGEQDVVVKSLGSLIGNRRGLSGATILGDGTLGLIIDIAGLVSGEAPLAASA
jgi:two-component system chemotaxis sensor kinase CheA